MQKRVFWLGLVVISLFTTFGFSFVTGTALFLIATAVWWWVVYRSGFFTQ